MAKKGSIGFNYTLILVVLLAVVVLTEIVINNLTFNTSFLWGGVKTQIGVNSRIAWLEFVFDSLLVIMVVFSALLTADYGRAKGGRIIR